MMPQIPCGLLSTLLIVVLVSCMGSGALGDPGPKDGPHELTDTHDKLSSIDEDDAPSTSLEEHQMRKRFIWTLSQEPYFYGKYEGSQANHGSEMLPEVLPLRKPTAMHKRLYPRWYQNYVYKPSSFSPMVSSVGERKRFQPFHPMARFRGLSMGGGGGSSSPSRGYHSSFDMPLSDQPGHPVPSAPNAQPSSKFSSPTNMINEEEAEVEQEEEDSVRAGDLLQYLRSLASDRGLSGNTKSFRFGISRK